MKETQSSGYQVIARKYRPQTLSEVIGQEPITATLRNALLFKRVAHAYLFCGCRGTGKTTLARIFAKALNCNSPKEDGEPCNGCPSCIDITQGTAIDVCEIDGASHRGIDDIREINETVHYAPSTRYKIYIIDEVHMLTKEAFNALLKTLEEPPSHVKFIFATTEPHKVLPTILSRCQRFDLQRIPEDKIAAKLSCIAKDLEISCEEAIFPLIASLSQGSLRDAESLLDQLLSSGEPPFTVKAISDTLGLLSQSLFFDLDQAFYEKNLSFAFDLASNLFQSGKELSFFLEELLNHYRTHLQMKMDPKRASLFHEEGYEKTNLFYTAEECLHILDFLIESQQLSLKIPFKRVHLEMILLHILRSKNKVTLPALIHRLEALQKEISKEVPVKADLPKKVEPASPSVVEKAPIADLQPNLPTEQPLAPVEKRGQCHYDTLLRFAAIELEGMIKPYKE